MPKRRDRRSEADRKVRLALVTDAWAPQVNGVVRTLEILGQDLAAMGHGVRYATPEGRFTLPLPSYPEIRMAVFPRRGTARDIRWFRGRFRPVR